MLATARIAALIGAGLAAAGTSPARADARITGFGEDTTIVAPYPGNIVGGALSRVVGTGESATVVPGAVEHAQAARVPRITGSGTDTSLSYQDPVPPMRMAQQARPRG